MQPVLQFIAKAIGFKWALINTNDLKYCKDMDSEHPLLGKSAEIGWPTTSLGFRTSVEFAYGYMDTINKDYGLLGFPASNL